MRQLAYTARMELKYAIFRVSQKVHGYQFHRLMMLTLCRRHAHGDVNEVIRLNQGLQNSISSVPKLPVSNDAYMHQNHTDKAERAIGRYFS